MQHFLDHSPSEESCGKQSPVIKTSMSVVLRLRPLAHDETLEESYDFTSIPKEISVTINDQDR
jgi:hypothetical protein